MILKNRADMEIIGPTFFMLNIGFNNKKNL